MVSAADRYFDLSTAAGLLGGVGTWDVVTQTWSSTSPGTSNPPLTWEQGADAFFNNAASNTLTLTGTIWANSITSIQNGAGGLGTTVNPASAESLLQLGGGGLNSRSGQPMFMNARVELLASQIWNLHSAMVASAAISDSGNGLGLTKTGASSLGLGANNTFTDQLDIQAGTVSLYGSGAVTSAGSVVVQGISSTASPTAASVALFKLDNVATNNNDRIGDSADVTVGRHGEFWLVANNAATTSERIGDLRLDTGHATISLEAGTSFLTLSASSLQRSGRATGVVRGTGLGQKTTAAVARLSLDTTLSGADFVGAGGAANGVGIIKTLAIVPWLLGDTQATFVGRDFVTYDTSTTLNSLRALNSSEYAAIATLGAGYSNVGENVVLGAATLNLTAGARTFNALLINGAATLNGAGGADDTLTINSGALAQVNGTGGTLTGFGLITFGNGEAVVSNVNTLRLNSSVTVSGGGGLTKTGAGTLVLAADNTFSGATVVNAGTLQVGVGGTSGSLGATTAVSLHGGNLTFNRSDDFSFNASITGTAVHGSANSGTLRHEGLGSLTLTGNNVIPGAISVAAGTLTLTGMNSAGQEIVRNGAVEAIVSVNIPTVIGTSTAGVGTLKLAGIGSLSIANGDLKVGDLVSGAKGRVYVDSGTSLSASRIMLGAINGSSGAFFQSGGTVVANNPASTPGIGIGMLGGYGHFRIDDGDLTANGMVVASGAGTGVGTFYQTGGNVSSGHHTYLTGAGSTGSSVYYMTGGTFTATGSNNTVYVGYTAGNAQLTIQDATFATPGDVSVGTAAGTNSVLNLKAGAILQATKIVTEVNLGATGTRHLNFDGGTLRYAGANTQSQLLRASSFYSVNILGGGATFDIVNNVTTVIEQAMVAPSGSGLSETTVNVSNGGAGYIGAPVVQISGATGATAVANMVSDDSGGLKVGSITITSPGIDASAASYNLVGGGFTSAATGGTLTTAANATTGGIQKTGIGRLHLSKANTYGGVTTISGGLLQLTATGSIDNSAGVIVNSGATFDLSPKANGYTVKNLSGAGTVIGVSGKATTVAAGGLLNLGDDGVGDLTFSAGNVVLDGSGLKSTISAAGVADKVKTNGTGSPTLSLAGTNDLQLALDFTPATVGQNYFLTDINGAVAISGIFETVNGVTTDLSQGAEFAVGGVSFAISYLGHFGTNNNGLSSAAGNDLVLTTTAVPEPAAIGLIGLAAAAMLRRRRREGRA
jgi:autotransporter-associated beta strand protein